MPDTHTYYWETHTDGHGKWRPRNTAGHGTGLAKFADGPPPGEDLAALRRGANREPGEVPEMWPFYVHLTADGNVSRRLNAEHVALTLFGFHQQSKRDPVHRQGVGLGTAIRALRHSNGFSEDAVDRRFNAAATATSLAELAHHLRGLVGQLKTVEPGTKDKADGKTEVLKPWLDYTRLVDDLTAWQYPESAGRMRRRWGGQYFTNSPALV